MGIKGIYRELGPEKRVSLSKLAVEHLESTGRPFRLAVDIAIWQFQAQAAKGGSNPAIRTLFYRLIRLLSYSILPVFVFDGPNKPAVKRNKRSGLGHGGPTAAAKQLIQLFGLPAHQAPGEAEAECAHLQQSGMVDAVLSEDVDTIMFGCTRSLRSWTSEGRGASNGPTHVTIYEAPPDSPAIGGLGRNGLVLVALLSGGDYSPEGVPGCGVKLACEIARAGFGDELCRLNAEDQAGLATWRAALKHELRTNDKGRFRTRHKALDIPDSFPDPRVLKHYTHPAVSSPEATEYLTQQMNLGVTVDIAGLREFVRRTFDWTNYEGAVKLIRTLSPSMLVQNAIHISRQTSSKTSKADPVIEPESLILSVNSQRQDWRVDGMCELRVFYLPTSVVPLDLSLEGGNAAPAQQDTAPSSDEDTGPWPHSRENLNKGSMIASKGGFDPCSPQPLWLPRYLAILGAPRAVECWEKAGAVNAQPKTSRKPQQSKKAISGTTERKLVTLDSWLRTSKAEDHSHKERASPGALPIPSTGPLSYKSQVASQRRALHSKATLTTNRSKLPKLPPRAGITDLAVHDDSRTLHFSQSMPRNATRRASQTDLPTAEPGTTWPPSPPSSVKPPPSEVKPTMENICRSNQGSASHLQPPRQDGTSSSRLSSNPQREAKGPLKQAKITTYLDINRERSSLTLCEVGNSNNSHSLQSIEPTKPGRRMTKLFIPCPAAPGFVRQVEVSEDEARLMLNEGNGNRGVGRRAWRQSNASLIDLTGEP